MEAKSILKKLLGSDTLRDELVASRTVPVTGEQGGRLLSCYLYSLEQAGMGPSAGAQAWLEGQKPRFMLHPAQKSCIEQALKFLPKLKEGLAKHTSAESDDDVPEPAFQSDDDFLAIVSMSLIPGACSRRARYTSGQLSACLGSQGACVG